MEIKFTHKGVNIIFKLENKICVVASNSVTGKTFMARLLEEYGKEHGIDVRLYGFDKRELYFEEAGSLTKDTIVILDDLYLWGDYGYKIADVIKPIRDFQATVILIDRMYSYMTRDLLANASYCIVKTENSLALLPERSIGALRVE